MSDDSDFERRPGHDDGTGRDGDLADFLQADDPADDGSAYGSAYGGSHVGVRDDGVDGGPDDPGADDDYYQTFSDRGRGRRGRRESGGRRNRAPLVILLVLAVIVVGAGVVGFGKLKDRLAPAADYAGPGTGRVVFQVDQGESVAAMGRSLRARGVVKSVDAFVEAARKDNRSTTIQVGYYPMKKQMSGSGALGVLIDPDNQLQTVLTVPEGARVRDIVKTVVAKTDFTRAQVVAALEKDAAIGLPAAAGGNPEGYLFPATYSVTPGETAVGLIKQMVAKTKAVESSLGVRQKAAAVDLDPQQVLTVASILQYEANRSVDYPKVARVIYNRLNQGMALQLDSTVSYTSGRTGDVWTTASERSSSSAYNTYANKGLPPGPIGSPGKETIEAALSPAKGDWLYFVPDFADKTTLFTSSYSQHLKNVAKAKEYCRTHSSC